MIPMSQMPVSPASLLLMKSVGKFRPFVWDSYMQTFLLIKCAGFSFWKGQEIDQSKLNAFMSLYKLVITLFLWCL